MEGELCNNNKEQTTRRDVIVCLVLGEEQGLVKAKGQRWLSIKGIRSFRQLRCNDLRSRQELSR